MIQSFRLTEELEKELSLNTTISFGVNDFFKSAYGSQQPMCQVCLLLVLGVVVTTCHLGGDTGGRRDTRDSRETRDSRRVEMIMIQGYWRSKAGS